MAISTTWPLPKFQSIRTLMLDPRNHRLPFEEGKDLAQRDLIKLLVEREDIYDLAKKLVRSGGVITAESLVAVKEGKKLIVVEGNRRLTALKLITDPALAPAKHKARFQKIGANIKLEAFKQAPVVIAPSREVADSYILLRHTKLPVKKWDPVQQGRFFSSILKNLHDVSALADEHNMALSDIRDAIQLYDLYRLAMLIKLPAEVDHKILDPESFPSSTLERIFKNPDACSLLGVKFDNNGRLKILRNPEEFIQQYTRIIIDTARDKKDPDYIDTRRLDKADSVKLYVNTKVQRRDVAPKSAANGIGVDDLINDTPASQRPEPVHAPTKKQPTPPQNCLINKGWTLECSNSRITSVLAELQSINLTTHENASAVLLRCLLDMCFQERFWMCPEWQTIVKSNQVKNKRKPDWHPTLRQMINAVCDSKNATLVSELAVSPAWIKAARKLVDDEVIDGFDYWVHNPLYTPTKQSLTDAWKTIEPIPSGLYPKKP